ncbi:glycosyltransferase [Williamsia serinedens]|uniref:UDP:flavonoid glycosyltransferase YjiC, YdhE family n=1 Tax=Williamsia serinedens TaxID=391736 RepID=A0ABT1H6P1_9NOCA|nr:glycosyltransferase [Williamsia serinedens]MCP2162906.1 UDP:flavonoid glycosyltransferase YjiC, YdhE family [Williamsia serinedens]
MRIAVSTYGSRGDVQPGACLGHELSRRGHDVTMLVPPNYVDFVGGLGLRAFAVGADSESYWETERGRATLVTRNPLTKLRLAREQVREGFALFDSGLSGAVASLVDDGGLDLVVTGPLGQDRCLALAERHGAALATMRFCAMSENGVMGPVSTARRLPPALNRAGWRLADRVTWAATRGSENRFRASLGLAPARGPLPTRLARRGVSQVQAYDATLFPGLDDEWGPARPLVGFLDLPDSVRAAVGDRVDPELDTWLSAGEAPVFVSFGNAPVGDPRRLLAAVADATASRGVRALVVGLGGRSGPDAEHRHVFHADRVDHGVVLPRCAAAIHHGGAGTTAATLRAALPMLICAAGADQAYWGARIRALRLGSSTRLARLDTQTLARGLDVVLDDATRRRVVDVSSRLVPAEEAVAAAVAAMETAPTAVMR